MQTWLKQFTCLCVCAHVIEVSCLYLVLHAQLGVCVCFAICN